MLPSNQLRAFAVSPECIQSAATIPRLSSEAN
jgi:hypothetical protein